MKTQLHVSFDAYIKYNTKICNMQCLLVGRIGGAGHVQEKLIINFVIIFLLYFQAMVADKSNEWFSSKGKSKISAQPT